MKHLILIMTVFCVSKGYAQDGAVGIGRPPHPSAVLDIFSKGGNKGIKWSIIPDSLEGAIPSPRKESLLWYNPAKGISFVGDGVTLRIPSLPTYKEKCVMGDTTISVFPPKPNAPSWTQEYALLDSARRAETGSSVKFARFKRARIFMKSPTGDANYTVFSYFNGQPVGSLTPEVWHLTALANERTSICGDFSSHQLEHDKLFNIPAVNITSGYHDMRRTEGHVQTLEEVVISPGDTVHTIEDAMFDFDFCGLDSIPLHILKLATFVYENKLRDSVMVVQSGTSGLFLQNDPCPNSTNCSYRSTHREVDSIIGSQFWKYKIKAGRGIEAYTSSLACGCEDYRKMLQYDWGVPDSLNMDCSGGGDAREFAKVMIYGFRGTYDGYQEYVFQETIDSLQRMHDHYLSSCAGVHPADTVRPWPGITAILAGMPSYNFDMKCLKLLETVHNQIRIVDTTVVGIIPVDTGWISAEQAWRRAESDSTGHSVVTAAKYLNLLGKEAGVDSVGLYFVGDSSGVMQVLSVFYNAATDEYIAMDPISGTVLSDQGGKFWDIRDAAMHMKVGDWGSIFVTGVDFNYSFAQYLTLDSCDRNATTNPFITPETATSYRTSIPNVVKIKSARTLEHAFVIRKPEWESVATYYQDPVTWTTWYDAATRGLGCMERIEGLPGLELQMRNIWNVPW